MPFAMAVRFEPDAAVGANEAYFPPFCSSYEPLTVGAFSRLGAYFRMFDLRLPLCGESGGR